MAVNITPYLTNSDDTSSFDAATAQAIDWYRSHKA